MKKLIFLLLHCIALHFAYAQTLTVATFNLRYDNKNDIGNLWKDRVLPVSELIRFHDFDVFGTQEGLINQLNDLSAALPEYARYGKGRDNGLDAGEHSAVFYKKDKFRQLSSGDFWLSETPGRPGKGWDATCCNRICSWVYLQEIKTGKKFYFFSVHFDHQGVVARRESAKLMIAKIKEIAKKQPAVLVGDFNSDREAEPYKILKASGLLHDSFYDVAHPYANNGSFNDFGKAAGRNEVIDHIFLTSQVRALKWAILTDTYQGKFPSDHFPVMAKIEIK